jgi:hypothetical protein
MNVRAFQSPDTAMESQVDPSTLRDNHPVAAAGKGIATLISHACQMAEELGIPVFPVRVAPDPKHPGKSSKQPLVRDWQNDAAVTNPADVLNP